jgi:hypothetical protein
MGLDMMARTAAVRPAREVDFSIDGTPGETMWSWRKHPDLHGWMEALYFQKGGKGVEGMDGPATFNCVPVVLTAEDLDSLELAVRTRTLPKTAGFFFGESRPEDQADDLAFIAAARTAIAAGLTVYYTSWW